MMGLGTLANVLAILAGGGLGLLLKGGLPERWQGALMAHHGSGRGVHRRGGGHARPAAGRGRRPGRDGVKDTLGMTFALALGTLVGEWIDLTTRWNAWGPG